MNHHLEKNGLMEREQRGEREKCSGTFDNLLIDRLVYQDSQRGKLNFSMAWVDVRKAFDTVDHRWLGEMFEIHRFLRWLDVARRQLSNRWNTRIVVKTKQGMETSVMITFKRGLPQGDAFCPRLFTLCLTPMAWKLKATGGYKFQNRSV